MSDAEVDPTLTRISVAWVEAIYQALSRSRLKVTADEEDDDAE